MKGRFYWAKRTQEGLARSMHYFRDAIECDPTYALAYAGLAEAYIPQGFYCHVPPTEAFPRARAAAERALEIDPDLSEARTVIASIKGAYEGDLHGAEQEARAAIVRSPNYPRAHQGLAEWLTLQGRFDEAIESMTRGLDLDPLALYMNAAVVMTYYFVRRNDAAIALYPSTFISDSLSRLHGVRALERASTLSQRSTMTLAALGAALAADGRTSEADGILRELDQAAAQGRYVSGVWEAAIHTAFGDSDRALSSLERGRQDRCCWLLRSVRLDPRFDALRNFPRFTALL